MAALVESYSTVAEATTYFASYRLVTDSWDDASADRQQIALNMARMIIDKMNYAGDKTDEDQDYQFPRGDDTSVPTDIKEAEAEIAYSLLDGVDPDIEYENLREISMGFASVRSTSRSEMIPEHIANGVPSLIAWDKLRPYFRDVRALTMMRTS